jgi:hypothetical protein
MARFFSERESDSIVSGAEQGHEESHDFWTMAEDADLKREWLAKLSLGEISTLHNRDKSEIRSRMKILNLI